MVIDTFLLYQKNSKTQDETMCHSTYYRKNATKGQTKTDDGDAAKIQGRNTALSDDLKKRRSLKGTAFLTADYA